MDAHDVRLTDMIDGTKQFIIPVFQRDYSWGTKQCLQLWQDIVRVGSDKNAKAHFVGSVVYVEAEETSATVTAVTVVINRSISSCTFLLTRLILKGR